MESGQVDNRGLGVSSGQAAPLLELVDAPLDGVAPLVGLAFEGWRAAADRPRFLRPAIWSEGCGITARIPRRRRWARIARDEYALSARTASGVVLGRPTGREPASGP